MRHFLDFIQCKQTEGTKGIHPNNLSHQDNRSAYIIEAVREYASRH